MPLLALRRCRSYISKKYFYSYGVKSASRPFYTLFISLISICFLSYPIIASYFTSHRASSFTPHIEAHLWQHSAHVQAATAVPHQPSFVARQIRITDATNDTLSKELLGTALSIYQVLTVSNKLREICATTQHRQCIIHSPLAAWNYDQHAIEQDTDIVQTINQHLNDLSNPTGLSLHPYATMGQVVLDDKGNFVSASSAILTFVLKNTTHTQRIWDDMVQHTRQQFPAVYTHPLHVEPCLLQYKLKLPLPLTSVPPIKLLTIVLFSMGLFIIVRTQFSKSTLLKSASGLGIAALFLAVACYTTTMGIFHYFFRTAIHVLPWFLQLLVCCTATLEHALCLTGAVVSKEKGIGIKERLGKGLQQVGVVMTTSLLGELFVLATGNTLNAPNVKAFCLFTSLALVVAYILNLTLFVAVLSIDIKRAELADLGDEEFEKRDSHHVTSPTRSHGNNGKSKTRRALNAFFLCIVILLLNFLSPSGFQAPDPSLSSPFTVSSMRQWSSISKQFWEALNPTYTVETLQVHAPYVMIVSSTTADESQKQHIIHQLTTYYSDNFKALGQLMKQRSQQHSILDSFHPYLLLAYSVNIPSIILLFILVCIIMWMTPWIREQYMLPFLRKAFVRIVTLILRILSSMTPIKTDVWIKKVENEYNEDGMHMGAISMQSRFNMLQNKNKVRNVSIKTLMGMHVADIRDMHTSGDLIASIGQQDGKIVLWSKSKGEWVARLDKLKSLGGGLNGWVAAERNRRHYRRAISRQYNKKQDMKYLPHARCIQIDQDQRYIVAGFEHGLICVWNADTVHLIRELTIDQHQLDDRVIRLLFIEMGRNNSVPLQPEKCILSVHRNGKLREWNINTGEMTQCIESGHTREITQTLIIPNNQHIDTSTYYIITASKDGTTQCWSRTPSQWTHLYTLTYYNMITSIAAQQLHNGMGILVTGSNDGAVQVWNLDSGTAICTLSTGGTVSKKINTADTAEVGGPLLQFSTVARSTTLDEGTYTAAYVSQQHQQHLVKSDHSDTVSQVVVTRISNPEFEHDTCPGCHTVINSGFFVASCALDESVHAWRLNRTALSKQEVGCSQCAKDYHRRQQALYNTRTARPPTAGPVSALRSKQRKSHATASGVAGRMYTSGEESESMCQQQQQHEMTLSALFLGKLRQEAGRGLVFCDNMVLAGCRRRRLTEDVDSDECSGDWEVWFSSLQYYEPPSAEEDAALIPVITCNLEKDDGALDQQNDISPNMQGKDAGLDLKDQLLLHMFGIKKVRSGSNTVSRPNSLSRKNVKSELSSAVKAVHFEDIDDDTSSSTITAEDDDDAEQHGDDEEEAYNALPFAAIRCVVPINGHGISCDYGNFIKVVTFSKQSEEKEEQVG
ncbi:hypothetical protein MAM1_0141d06412 [Mucor ambiguus]|uniref:Sterol regulatory element-binding protein cleavage-activating protein n=1 Tax=Mucor ambiguus TaxID=91626 RepID=A0A0C9MU35_9FUNG|nr:hypothetical protein MAM1_0141d06412 [Mucor ambiguus]